MAEIIERGVKPQLETDGEASGRGVKHHNEYELSLNRDMYHSTPKAVFAAIAMSFAARDGGLEEAQSAIISEWVTLFEQGIVPQDPKKYLKRGIE
jgi:hypothetical protein